MSSPATYRRPARASTGGFAQPTPPLHSPRRQSHPHQTPTSTTTSLPSLAATRNSRTALLPPPTPLPQHPSAESGGASSLSTAATAFALKAYLETYLITLGWDPALLSASAFITQYSWLLGEELALPAPVAAGIFNELFDATTPTMAGVCHAVIGMEEKLGCSRQAAKAVRRLFTKNHEGKSPEWALSNWSEEVLERKCAVDMVKGRKRVGGWWAVVRVAAGKMCGGKKNNLGDETDVEGEKR